MKFNLLLIILFLTLTYNSILYSQGTGFFEKEIPFGKRTINVAFYVPFDYDSTKSYPVVMGMSFHGESGRSIRNRLMLALIELEVIAA